MLDWQYLFSSFSSNCRMMWKLLYIWFIFWTRNRFRWHFLLLIKFSDWQMENSILSICLERDGGRQYPWRLQNKSLYLKIYIHRADNITIQNEENATMMHLAVNSALVLIPFCYLNACLCLFGNVLGAFGTSFHKF